jgi:hypothetical protein
MINNKNFDNYNVSNNQSNFLNINSTSSNVNLNFDK